MELHDCYEKAIDYCCQLGWFEKKKNDFRQVELMNYAYPVIITITGLAYNEIAIECTTEIRHNLTRFHKETIQKMIVRDVINKKPELSSSLKWICKKNGDINWILNCLYPNGVESVDFQADLSKLLLIADLAWNICKRKCNLMGLIDSNGFVLPIENCIEKIHSVYAAIKYLELFDYSDIGRILLGAFLYNLPYRDVLRKNGIDDLINYICKQEPELQLFIELWERIRTEWNNMHYKFGKFNIRLIHTFDTYHVLGTDICGLNETLELLEYNTIHTEFMYEGKWIGSISSADRDFVFPLLGKEIDHSPDYNIHIRIPKHQRENIHVAQYWDVWDDKSIFDEIDNFSVCMFKKESFVLEEILNLRKIIEKHSKWSCESLRMEQLPALCFIEKKPYMLLITKSE